MKPDQTNRLNLFLGKPIRTKKVNRKNYDPTYTGILSSVVLLFMILFMASCDSSLDEMNGLNEVQKNPDKPWAGPGIPELLTDGIAGASGSAIGPGGALFVTEGATGSILRIDPKTGEKSTYASGLPSSILPIGGAYDLTFIGGTAYVLVTLVSESFFYPPGTPEEDKIVSGIYRMDGPDNYTIVADLGAFSKANIPTNTGIFLEYGLQYAIETYQGGFLVSDGHHNRVLHATLDGEVSVFRSFDNIVPTGLEVSGNTVYMAQAGASPHEVEDGSMVISFTSKSSDVTEVGSGAPLLVDVEFNRGRSLFALAQGTWGNNGQTTPGDPADPNTGSLVRINDDGTFTEIAGGLNLPTSVEFIGNTAYIINLAGEVLTIKNAASPPFGM